MTISSYKKFLSTAKEITKARWKDASFYSWMLLNDNPASLLALCSSGAMALTGVACSRITPLGSPPGTPPGDVVTVVGAFGIAAGLFGLAVGTLPQKPFFSQRREKWEEFRSNKKQNDKVPHP